MKRTSSGNWVKDNKSGRYNNILKNREFGGRAKFNYRTIHIVAQYFSFECKHVDPLEMEQTK